MKLPDSAVKQIESMVHSFLPYESDYEPKTPQSSLIEELFKAVATPNPQLRQWAGFVMYFMKQVDDQPDKQKDVDSVAEIAHSILSRYGYGKAGGS
jgi:hypothetical protein